MSDILEAAGGRVTTLCRCWRVTRADGMVLGFTDHDGSLHVDGVDYLAATGIDAAAADASMGLAVEDAEIAGALSSDALDEDDIARGLYDGAEVALFLVDWTDPAARTRLATYVVGEIARAGGVVDGVSGGSAGGAFRAELRGLTERLTRPTARRFRRACDAELGDARCGVRLDVEGRTLETAVASVDDGALTLDEPGAPGVRFAHGRIEWLTGANAGAVTPVASAPLQDGVRTVRPWRPADRPVLPGDRLRLVAGCDKSLATCRDRYANAANHRGFPHLPGNDFAFSYVAPDGAHDGRPLVE